MNKFKWPIIGLVVLAFVFWLIVTPGRVRVSVYDGFAQCIRDSGAIFYGAFWCPHCQNQKKMFGSASQYLPYVECSTPDGNGQLQVCKDAGVTGYPTWVFLDGTIETGLVSFERLSELSNCPLPSDV